MDGIKLLIHEIYNNFESSNLIFNDFYKQLITKTEQNIKKCNRIIRENEKLLNDIEYPKPKEQIILNPYIEKVAENNEEIILYYCYNINNGSTYWQNYKEN